MKKKKLLPLIGLVILFVALIGSYIGLKSYNDKQEETTEEEAEVIMSVDKKSILNMVITNSHRTMEFSYDVSSNKWKYPTDTDFPLDSSKLESIMVTVSSLTAARHLEDTLDNIAEYGLDNPAYTLSLSGDDSYTLYIGNKSSSGKYYAYLDGKNTVYTIDDTLPEELGKSLSELVVEDIMPSIDSDKITEIAINGETYKYVESAVEEYDYTMSNNWFKVNEDGSYKALDTTAMSSINDSIVNLKFDKCVSYNPVSEEEKAKYGLDAEHVKVIKVSYYDVEESDSDEEEDADSSEETTASTEETKEEVRIPKEITLYIGEKNDEDQYFVSTSLSNLVNVVSSDTIDGILVDSTSLASKNVFGINISNINSLTVNANGKDYLVASNGEETDTEKYDSVFQKLYGLMAAGNIEDVTKVQPINPELTLSYNLNNPKFPIVTMEFTKYNGSYYQATINGNTEALVLKSDIEEIIKEFEVITP